MKKSVVLYDSWLCYNCWWRWFMFYLLYCDYGHAGISSIFWLYFWAVSFSSLIMWSFLPLIGRTGKTMMIKLNFNMNFKWLIVLPPNRQSVQLGKIATLIILHGHFVCAWMEIWNGIFSGRLVARGYGAGHIKLWNIRSRTRCGYRYSSFESHFQSRQTFWNYCVSCFIKSPTLDCLHNFFEILKIFGACVLFIGAAGLHAAVEDLDRILILTTSWKRLKLSDLFDQSKHSLHCKCVRE